MNVSQATIKVLRFQYHLARFPLQLIEDRVVARLGSEAPARLLYERSLGTLDATIGKALGDSELAMLARPSWNAATRWPMPPSSTRRPPRASSKPTPS